MFTGIVEATARILKKTETGLSVERPAVFDDIKTGSSINVCGACLSVVAFDASSMRFDVVPETWAKTMLGRLQKGDRVNLERAMKASDRLEGHVVQGHVEGVGEVLALSPLLTLELPTALLSNVLPKGSIAVAGVSLTVASVEGNTVGIALIPHTLENTILGSLIKGDQVNIETDVMVRARYSGYSDSSHAH